MYNMLVNVHPTVGNVLAYLGLDPEDCGRFRDAYITKDCLLAIYTRCGGGNRADYQDMYTRLRTHPQYSLDEDDSFDNTYSTIYFNTPPKYMGEVLNYITLAEKHNRLDLFDTPTERVQHVIDDIGK